MLPTAMAVPVKPATLPPLIVAYCNDVPAPYVAQFWTAARAAVQPAPLNVPVVEKVTVEPVLCVMAPATVSVVLGAAVHASPPVRLSGALIVSSPAPEVIVVPPRLSVS